MSWKNILKKDELNEVAHEVINMLDDFLNSQLTINGTYDDEQDGYYDAERQDDLYLSYPNVSITIDPSSAEEGLVTEFDLYFDNTRLGSYTGGEGHYLAQEDWTNDNLDDLKELLSALKDWNR